MANKTIEQIHFEKKNISQHIIGKRYCYSENDITDEILEKCCKDAALMVKIGGDVYLPIFERLYKELKARKNNNDIKNIAIKIASNDNDIFPD
jgi:hypothetical protein